MYICYFTLLFPMHRWSQLMRLFILFNKHVTDGKLVLAKCSSLKNLFNKNFIVASKP